MTLNSSRRWRRLWLPTLLTLAAGAVLVSLGVWQLERLAWKTALIEAATSRPDAPPVAPPAPATWDGLDWDEADLTRLERLVRETAARRLIVLGDLFHARSGCTQAVFDEFTATRSRMPDTEVLLIAGNHDRAIGKIPPSLGIDSCLRTHDEPPFHFVHEPATDLPEPDRTCFTIAGHMHPTVTIGSPSGDRITERCFVAEAATLVLPAFGSFTGGHRMRHAEGLRLWIARDDGVVDVTQLAEFAAKTR
jgi:DNA ligase-associated metallophosphoesterase